MQHTQLLPVHGYSNCGLSSPPPLTVSFLIHTRRIICAAISFWCSACTGRSLMVGSRPLQLWPLLLCKAILKVMAVYRSLDMTLPHQVRTASMSGANSCMWALPLQ